MRRNPTQRTASPLVLRKAFSFIAFLCFVWFLFQGIMVFHSGHESRKSKESDLSPTNLILKHYLKMIGRERHAPYWNLDLNTVSKRRVPNGPDPIHNRRAVKYRQPPGV